MRRGGPIPGRALLRLLVTVISAGGVLSSGALWATGHAATALRVLAGDVLALVLILLVASR